MKRSHPRAIHFFSSILLSVSEGEKAARLWKDIDRASRIVLTSHITPDGDAIGSLLGMYHTLRSIGKESIMICQDPAPDHLLFLPGADQIRSPKEITLNPDLVIVLDCSHPSRIGESMEVVKNAQNIAVIDHHADSQSMTGVHIVDERASSTGEILFRLIKHAGFTITREASLALYVAILTDTGSFRYGNTSSVSFNIASELMQTGAIDVHTIGTHIFARDTVSRLRLRGMVSERAELRDGIIFSCLDSRMIESAGSNASEAEGLIDDLSLCRDAEIAVIFWECPDDVVRVQLRSIRDKSVLGIAAAIGGGGHKRAAGGRMKGVAVDEVMRRVFEAAGRPAVHA